MGGQDITEKMLEDYNDVFADIVNVLLFNGERVIDENGLSPTNDKSMLKFDSKIHEQERDISKIYKNHEIVISEVGFENQTAVDDKMPFRVFSYDGASYKRQLVRREGPLYPVMTLVLYFGAEHWNKPRNIKSLFSDDCIFTDYVNDYKIHVFEIAYLPDEVINKFKSDFAIVARFFKNKRLKKHDLNDEQEIKHVDEILKFLSAATGDDKYEVDVLEMREKKKEGVINMCSIAEAIANKGREEGIEQGEVKILLALNKSIDEISDITGFSIQKVEDIIEKLKEANKHV